VVVAERVGLAQLVVRALVLVHRGRRAVQKCGRRPAVGEQQPDRLAVRGQVVVQASSPPLATAKFNT